MKRVSRSKIFIFRLQYFIDKSRNDGLRTSYKILSASSLFKHSSPSHNKCISSKRNDWILIYRNIVAWHDAAPFR